MSLTLEQAVEVLRAAGEPTRLRILALLAHEELAVMELGRILGQSQPRVSRHLRLLAEAGLVERFPDGAWVFYRLAVGGRRRELVDEVIAGVIADDAVLAKDAEQLDSVREERSQRAIAYFERNAVQWDRIRSLYVSDSAVEAAIIEAAGQGPFRRLVDLGSGTGRMLTLLGPSADSAIGLDLSQHMLNVARANVARSGLARCELRHGDIFGTRLPGQSADLVVVHQVLHYLGDPPAAVREAGRLVAEGGRLVVVDFAPHDVEFLREQHQHRRLGFSEGDMARWLDAAGLSRVTVATLPPAEGQRLTVKIWTAERARQPQRSAA